MFEVQKVAPPIPSSVRGGTRKYPFADMEIGGFFFIPGREKNNMATHAATAGKKHGKRFITRLVIMHETPEGWQPASEGDEDAVKGIGVWCQEPKAKAEPSEAEAKALKGKAHHKEAA